MAEMRGTERKIRIFAPVRQLENPVRVFMERRTSAPAYSAIALHRPGAEPACPMLSGRIFPLNFILKSS